MISEKLCCRVALRGPLRRSFSYSLPPAWDGLEPGSRLIVPFGRSRKVGFFIGYCDAPRNVHIRPVDRVLDESTLFNRELFDFLIWMADYYFANPADCLAAALPPLLKSNHQPDYFWSDDAYQLISENFKRLPREAASLVHPGRKLPQSHLKIIKGQSPTLVRRLLQRRILRTDWSDQWAGTSRRPTGYRVNPEAAWEEFFQRRRTELAPFNGAKSKSDLNESGWTNYLIGEAVKSRLILPEFSEGEAGLLEFIEAKPEVESIRLNKEQTAVFDRIRAKIGGGFSSTLLHGVTGSGKTVVYCHVIREVLKAGLSALVLTPEIALTGNMLAYFRAFFGSDVGVIHSSMTDRERYESWMRIRKGQYRVAIGPRSAIFAPMQDLGIIIVDEEHDGSYKQDDPSPRFHGRDAAIMRARMGGVPVILGSASPSLESYQNARSGRYELMTIRKRPVNATLPTVRVIDMRKDRIRGDMTFFSYALKQAIDRRLESGEQSILYLNRRGYAPSVQCADCGHFPECPNCRVKLTYHKVGKRLSCHYCGYINTRYDRCEKCRGNDLIFRGAGTQKVEDSLPRLFTDARTMRMDSDVVFGRKKAYELLRSFSNREADMLLGTQMVTKGLDLPEVTLVGVLSGDAGLGLPDFRSGERAFARLLQVSGRCGRADKPGEVFIQTFDPEHDIIGDAARQDYEAFFDREIESRRVLTYPPFSHIINFILSSDNEQTLQTAVREFHGRLMNHLSISRITPIVLGPAECPLYYLRGQYRRHLFMKTKQPVRVTRMLTSWEESQTHFGLPSAVKIVVDVDPDSMM